MECFCFFLIIIISVIAVNLFSKKGKDFENHGESEDLKRHQAKQRLAERQREQSPVPPKLVEIKAKLEEEKQRLTKLKREELTRLLKSRLGMLMLRPSRKAALKKNQRMMHQ